VDARARLAYVEIGMNPRSFLRGTGAFPFVFLIALLAGIASLSVPAGAASVPGHVEAWGAIPFGQLQPPAGLDDVVAVAAGNQHNLALRTNGTVVAWGRDEQGETFVPPDLTNVVAISASGHNVALKGNGSIVLWGHPSPDVTNVPPGLTDVATVAAGNSSGNNYTVALRSNGTVVAWGLMTAVTNVPSGLSGVIAVAAGLGHVLALKSDGTVAAWGDNTAGAATPPPGLNGVVAVRAGQFTSFAIKSDGTVVGWGDAVVPGGLNGIIDLGTGNAHTIALRTNGQVIAWGDNNVGQATVPEGLSDVTAISAGGNHNIVLTPRPIILSISAPVTANAGDTVTFSVSASAGPLTYEWQHNGANVAGATNSSIVLTNVQAGNAGVYRVRVRNPYGSVLSGPTFLAFPPPVITAEPEDLTRYRGESATFSVMASGLAPLSYQWRKDGTNVPGATSTTLTLLFVSSTNAGGYDVRTVDAAGGSVTSRVALLIVIDPRARKQLALTPAVDTSIFSSGGNPMGAGSILAGTRSNGIRDRGLMRFNLASISAGAVIESAWLRLTVTRVPQSPANSDFSLHRMLKAWGTDATWNNATAGVPWVAPGAASGVDFAGVKSATRFVAGGGAYDFGPSAQLISDISSWINDPAANYGWLLKTDSESVLRTARHFGSSESTQRPQLSLEYSTPAPRPHLTDISLAGGNFAFRFAGTAGWFYRVQTQADFAGPWTTVTNVAAGAATTPIEISVPQTDGNHFYRVIAE
jgi:hypothetical protein